jgi:hypothetical protein
MREVIIVFITVKRAAVKNLPQVIEVDRDVRAFPQPFGKGGENRSERGENDDDKKKIEKGECADPVSFCRRALHANANILRNSSGLGNLSRAIPPMPRFNL